MKYYKAIKHKIVDPKQQILEIKKTIDNDVHSNTIYYLSEKDGDIYIMKDDKDYTMEKYNPIGFIDVNKNIDEQLYEIIKNYNSQF